MSATNNRFELLTLERLQEIYDLISVYPPGVAVWGSITGTLSAQTDLQSALNAKQDTLTLTTTGTSGPATLIGSTLNIPQYSGGGGGGVTSVTASAPLASSGGTTPDISIPVSSATANGYLSSTDWIAFNSKFNTPSGTTLQYVRGDGSLATFPSIPTVSPSALTKTDDTNVTLTLGGSPTNALLQAVSIAVGWTGTLADSRIASASTWNAKQDALVSGTNIKTINSTSLLGSGDVAVEPTITAGTTSQYWRGDKTWQNFPSIPSVTPSALTKVDDTNVTLTLGGTPSTSLLQAVSLTLGWTGTLADSRIASAATWNAKQDAITLTTTGTSGAATLVGSTLNIPNYATASTPVKLTSQTLSSASWSYSGGYYQYTFSNVNIDTTCDVSVTPQNASYMTAYSAQILPYIAVGSGSATFYSLFPAQADIVVDIVITQTV